MAEKITDSQVSDLLSTLRSEANTDVKIQQLTVVQQLTAIKSGIKQHNVPESCAVQLFEALRLASANQHGIISHAGFTALNYLLTRLSRQQPKLIIKADPRILSLVLDKLGDQSEKLRILAIQALTTFYSAAPSEVERCVRNLSMAGKNPRAKEASMQWLQQMHEEQGLPFRAYVPSLMELLEDADAGVREQAKATVIALFRNASNAAKSDVKKQLKVFKVRTAIEQAIVKELGFTPAATTLRPESPVDIPRPPSRPNLSASVSSISSERPATPMTEGGADSVDPIYVNTNRELDDMFRDMQPYFEGRETEQNWLKREESATKLRRLIAGNASTDFVELIVSSLKGMLDGILKAVTSLRTSLSKEGCALVQDMVTTFGPAIEPMVELLMQTLIKLSAATKKISSQQANATVDTIIGKVAYSHRIMQHVWNACQDKNVQPRTYAAGWLRTLLIRESSHKGHVEHSGGLDMIDKCIKKGLIDANPGVREKMRSTYWTYTLYWPARADAIMASLDATAQKLLNNDAHNPNGPKSDGPVRPGLGLSKSTMGAGKASLREAMMSQKIALATEKRIPVRPGSAMSHFSPVRTVSNSSTISSSSIAATPVVRDVRKRPESAMATAAGLSGAPMRPARRKPDLARPATAGPYSVRSHDQPSVEATSPTTVTPKPHVVSSRRTGLAHTPHTSESSSPSPIKTRPNEAASPPKTHPSQTVPSLMSPTRTPIRRGSNQTSPPPNRATPARLPAPKRRLTQSGIPLSSPSKVHDDPTIYMPKVTSSAKLANETVRLNKPRTDEQVVERHADQLLPTPVTRLQRTDSEAGDPEAETHISRPQAESWEDGEGITTAEGASTGLDRFSDTPAGSPQIKVFEDPDTDEPTTPRQTFSSRVLEVKSVNEAMATPAHVTIPSADEYRDEELSRETRVSARLLESGLSGIKAKSLDVHGFRKFQVLLREGKLRLSDEKFDGLVLGLFQFLQDPLVTLGPEKAQDVKAQVLSTIKLLWVKDRERFKPHVSAGLEWVTQTRSGYDSPAYIVSELEQVADGLVELGEPSEVMASTWARLRGDMDQCQSSAVSTDSALQMTQMWRRVVMGLHMLRCVLERGVGLPLPDSEVSGLVTLARRCLVSSDSGVRMGTVHMCVALHTRIGDTRFWDSMVDVEDDMKSLMMYYITRGQKREGGHKS